MIKLYSEEFLKLLVEKQKEPVTEMLKDNLPLSKILKYSIIGKESIYQIAKDSNLRVIDDTVSESGYSKAFQELIDKEIEKKRKKLKKESIITMLKKKYPLNDIIECLFVKKKYVLKTAKENNLPVNDKNKGKQKV